MKKTILTCLVAALAGLAMTCASAGPATGGKGGAPAWMADLEAVYPDGDYLAAVGTGDTRKGAEANAAGSVAGRLKLDVKQDFTGQERYMELVKGNSSYSQQESAYLNTVNTSTGNQEFQNLRYSDPWTDSRGTVNVVAYLDRKETGKLYLSLIRKDMAVVESLRTRAAGSDSALMAFGLLDAALQVCRNSERLAGQLRIIHPVSAKTADGQIMTETVLKERADAASRMAYRLEITGDSDGKIGGILKKTLSDMGISENPAGKLRLDAKVTMEDVEVNPKYKSVRWTIQASLVDEKGSAVATMFKESRENGITAKEAASFAIMEVEKAVKKEFAKKITSYFDSLALGK